MLEHMFHQDQVEGIVLERPWRLFDIHEHIGAAIWEVVGIDPTFPVVETAAEVQHPAQAISLV
jgi:hypothetical protein